MQFVRFLFVVVLFAPVLARAQSAPQAKRIVVIESHVGVRPPEFGRFMEVFADRIEMHGYAARPRTILSVGGRLVPRPGVLDPELTAAVIAKHVNAGIDEYGAGRCADAIRALETALQEINRNPGLMSVDTTNNELSFRARVTLAVCYQREGNAPASTRAMRDAITTNSQRPISRADTWGPEGEKLYRETVKDLQKHGRGQISIAAGDPNATIFVNGQLRGMGNAEVADVIPGTSRVFVRLPGASVGNLGRQYDLEVRANETSTLIVDARVDDAVMVTDQYATLIFPTSEARTRSDAKLAGEIARRWSGRDVVAIVSSDVGTDGRAIAVARLVERGNEERKASVPLDGPPETVTSLARFVADGATAPGVTVLHDDGGGQVPRSTERRRSSKRAPIALTITGGVTMIAGSVLLARDEEDDGSQLRYSDTTPPAVTLLAAGGAAMAVGLLGLKLDRPTAPYLVVALGVVSIGAGAALVLVDEDATSPMRSDIVNTAPVGTTLAIAGSIITTGGILWWLRNREHAPDGAPIVDVSGTETTIGWAGRF